MNIRAPRWALSLFAALALLFPLVIVADAHAGGTISVSKSELTESNGGWKLFLTVKLGKKPANPTQTFRFIFTPTVLYETFQDDAHGDAEQTRNIPQGKDVDPIRASLDVGFSDMKGQIWDTTKFDFTIRRENGVMAGEYSVEVRDSDNNKIGSAFKVKLAGSNPVVDRRAIVMADPGAKKKKKDPAADTKSDSSDAPSGAAPSGPVDTDATAARPGDPDAAPPPPPPVEPKAGGCGCEVPVSHETPWAPGALVALGLVTLALRRRA